MKTTPSKIWTTVTISISDDDDRFITSALFTQLAWAEEYWG